MEGSPGLLERSLAGLAAACNRHWFLTLVAATALTVAGGIYASNHLKPISDRNDLVNKDADFNIRFEEYLKDFGDQEYIIIVIEGDDRPAMKELAHRLSDRVRGRPDLFTQVIERIDPQAFGDIGMLYLPLEDLGQLADRLEFIGRAIGECRAMDPETIARTFARKIRRSGDSPAQDLKDQSMVAAGLLAEYFYGLYPQPREGGDPLRMMFDIPSSDKSFDVDGYLFSADGTLLYLQVMPVKSMTSLDQIEKPVQAAREMLAEELGAFPSLRAGITGLPTIYSDEMSTTNADMTKATIIGFCLVALLFIASFRDLVRPILGVITVAISVGWTLGFAALVLGRLNLFAMVFASVLVAQGADFGIHILTHYRQHAYLTSREAIHETLLGSGRALMVGALTTAVAFFSATLSGFAGLAELGIVSAAGLLICLLAMCTLFPALLGMVDGRRKELSFETRPEAPAPATWPTGWVWVGILALAGAALAPGVTFDYNLLELQSHRLDSVIWEFKMLRDPRALFCVSMVDTREELEERRARIAALPTVARVETLFPGQEPEKRRRLSRLGSMLALLPAPEFRPADAGAIRAALMDLIAAASGDDFKMLRLAAYGVHDGVGAQQTPKEAARRLAVVEGTQRKILDGFGGALGKLRDQCSPPELQIPMIPADLRTMFVGAHTGQLALKIFPRENVWEWEPLGRFVSDLRTVDPLVAGVPVQTYESSQILLRAFLKAAWLSLCAIFLLIGLSFWNVRDMLIALSPLLLGVAILLGIMRVMGLSFNFANFFAVPILIGTAVDYGVHLVFAARSGMPMTDTRRAVTLCSLTTIIGFGTLVLAEHRGIQSLGEILAIGSICSLLVSHTVTTALVRAWRPR